MPLRLEVRWNGFSGGIPTVTGDISLGGCYIESLYPVTIGDILYFEFLPSTRDALRLQSQVLYKHQNIGFGVRFTDLDARQQVLELLMPSAPENETCKLPQSIPGKLAAQYN